MRLQWTFCLILIGCLLVGLDARKRGGHHHKKKGRKHGHGHGHINTWDKSSSNKHEVHMRKISWLNVPEVTGCQCKHKGQICILGPGQQPTCVQEHHLRESARLFKHYHERKEEAEEHLNEVDPPAHSLHLDPPHDVHISVASQHKASHKHPSHVTHGQQEHGLGLKPKPGKHSLMLSHLSHSPQRTEGTYNINQDSTQPSCDQPSLDEMRRRLIGWFHLLHGKDHHRHHHKHHKSHRHLSVKKELREADDKPCDCLKSVMWEFRQIDTDKSHSLNKTEVKVIDNNDMEPCLHPYLMTCDKNKNGLLSRHEWCCCFQQKESESPCYARLNEIETTKNTEMFIPSCDHEGYYQKEQCMGDAPTTQTCWCVTPTGSEIPGSRRTGRAHCGKLDNMGYPKTMS